MTATVKTMPHQLRKTAVDLLQHFALRATTSCGSLSLLCKLAICLYTSFILCDQTLVCLDYEWRDTTVCCVKCYNDFFDSQSQTAL